MDEPQPLAVLVTASGDEEAEQLALALLQRRLIACANVVPHVRSVFRWQNRVERADESLLIVKTTVAALPELIKAVKLLHSYQMPEVVALPIVGGSTDYLSWLASEIRPPAVTGE